MEDQPKNKNSELWSLSLRDLFYKYVRFLPIFILSVAVALFAAYAYLRYATPIYSSTATLIIKSDDQGGRNEKFNDIFGAGKTQNIQSEIEILKSKSLMQRVAKKSNLQFSYFAKGKIKTLNIYNGSPFYVKEAIMIDSNASFTFNVKFENDRSFKINNTSSVYSLGTPFTNAYGTFLFERNPNISIGSEYILTHQPLFNVAAGYASAVGVAPKSIGTGILNISIQGTNPTLCANIVNMLMAEYGDYTKELKNKASDQRLSFIDDRMVKLRGELEESQKSLLKYTQENNIVDIEKQLTSYLGNVQKADGAIFEQQLLLKDIAAIKKYLQDEKSKDELIIITSPLALSDATLNEVVRGYNQVQFQKQQLLASGTPVAHPQIIELNMQMDKFKKSVIDNLNILQKAYDQTISQFRKSSGESQEQLKILPYKAKDYYELKTQVDNKNNIYNILQEAREQTAISRASNVENSQIVELASPIKTPIKPNRRSIQIMAILIGLGIPALFVFAAEVLNDKVSTRFDIEKITTAPILGEIGHSYSEKVLIVNKVTRSMVAEQFRIIRSNLQYILGKNEKPTIIVTSSFSGEGKSFVSTNSGAVLALAGKKTVILEFDIRKPKVLSGLSMTKRPGITNFLVGNMDNIDELVTLVPGHDNLYVMACGPIPPNPSELLLGSKVDEMFKALKERFDAIVIDTAPIGMVSDAMTLGQFADCSFYIVRQGHTFKKQIAMIDEFYTQGKLPKISIVINDVKMKAGYGYYGYGRYGYGYGYGYGGYYEEEHPPKSMFDKLVDIIDVRRWFRKKRKK